MRLEVLPVQGLPLVHAGADLPRLITQGLRASKLVLCDEDVVVVAQKAISKAEGRLLGLDEVEPSPESIALAKEVEKDSRLVEVILRESEEIVRRKPGVLIVRNRLGIIGANAGVDQSNIEHRDGGSALPLPEDPDRSAEKIRCALETTHGVRLGVIISDSANRPWRLGTIGIAIGISNLQALDDRRGEPDLYGRELKTTLIGRADAIASAAVLIMGEAAERTPAAIVRGLPLGPAGDTAKSLLRSEDEDLFR